MAETAILIQSNATTPTAAYTSSSTGLGTVISTIMVCNTGTAADVFNVEVVPSGGTEGATAQFLFKAQPIAANSSVPITIGATLPPGASLYLWAGTANTAFNGFGMALS